MKILAHFEASIFNDIIVIAVFILVTITLFKKVINQYIFSDTQIITIISTTFLYILYRTYSIPHTFTFTKLYILPLFAYWDFILLFPSLSLCLFFFERFLTIDLHKYLFKPSPKTGGFVPDSPLTEKPLQNTKVDKFAAMIADKLLKTDSINSAFAVGIVGEWGTGKTSLLNLLKEALKEQKNTSQEIIEIDFNPWNSASPEAIITDFFEAFQEKLSEYSAEIDDSINNYTQKLAKIEGEDWISKILKVIADFWSENKTMNQEYETINAILRKINRQIYIFIDDLDRLDKKEIIEVIRLIRNSANFHNTFFIVAYEKAYIEQAIEDLNPQNKSFFLEKIFQLEVHLPKYEYHIIAVDLYNQLTEHIPFLKENIEIEAFIKKHKGLSDIIQNFRDVKRFVNSFSLVYTEQLAKEVYFPDFFHVELIRFKYPLIYDLLRKQPNKFLTTKPTKFSSEWNYSIIVDSETKKTSIQTYLEEEKIYSSYIQKIETLLLQIFEENKQRKEKDDDWLHSYLLFTPIKENEKSKARYPNHFATYFAYRPFDNIIGNEEFELAIKDAESFKKAIESWSEKDMEKAFNDKCKEITNFNSDEERIILISGIFYFGQIKPREFSYSDSDLLKLFDFKDKDLLKQFVNKLFENANYPYWFESDFLNELNKDFNDTFILNTDKRNQLLITYLQKIVDEVTSFHLKDESISHLLSWTFNKTALYQKRYKSSNSYSIEVTHPKEAKDIIIKFIKEKDLIGAFEGLIEPSPWKSSREEQEYLVSNYFLKIFDTWDNFETILRPIDSGKEEIKEFWAFYDSCKKIEFKHYIPYIFKHLKVKRNN